MSQNSVVLLTRLLSLKEPSSSFYLILDTLAQSSYNLIQEIVYNSTTATANTKIIYLSFETVNKPKYPCQFLDCTQLPLDSIVKQVQTATTKTLVIIDSLNYIANDEITTFLTRLANPLITLLGTYHQNCPIPQTSTNYPSVATLLSYIATTIFQIEPTAQFDQEQLSRLNFPTGVNSAVFKLELTNRRKSGRSLIYRFIIDVTIHDYQLVKQQETEVEDESLLKDLTTFNLTTSDKQKLAREQVELPFMEAQESLGSSSGGAIVYEFEKDDDYDEEDPYEDPF
ncbi:Elongator complex protein 5 [Spathaspora sp. JA1]|nr:Elongator complex protein 5 [Spathaspora sp. JA1]